MFPNWKPALIVLVIWSPMTAVGIIGLVVGNQPGYVTATIAFGGLIWAYILSARINR